VKKWRRRLTASIVIVAAIAGIAYAIKARFGSPAPEIALLRSAADGGADAIRKIAASTTDDEERRARLLLGAATLQASRLEQSSLLASAMQQCLSPNTSSWSTL
jgi:hypothetical protein